ncbi:hypothetical protein COCOBI_07-1850 [Coccomyxa sp. Obi]|nr:hypothetical protein COCOBI_07-1850 [Coccomyxa sp. Obi]
MATGSSRFLQTQALLENELLSGSDTLSLSNRRILFTSPRQYATKLAARLTGRGARPVWVPAIEIARLTDSHRMQALDQELSHLDRYSHLAFTSRNGIAAVLERLATMHGSLPAAAAHLNTLPLRCCALGADAEMLADAGVDNVLTPQEASTQGLVAELQRRGEVEGAAVLCPVPCVAGGLTEPPIVPRFLAALQAAGAHAIRVDAYETRPGATQEQCAAERQLLAEGHIYAVAFTSTAEAEGLQQIMGGKEWLQKTLKKWSTVLAAHGPYTAAGAGQVLGLNVTCVSHDFKDFSGLVRALELSACKMH